MTAYDLDPEMAAFVERYLAVSGLSTATTVAQQRLDYDKIVEYFRYPRPDGVTSEDATLEGRHGPIPIRRYRPRRTDGRARLLFFHGGGFILGSHFAVNG